MKSMYQVVVCTHAEHGNGALQVFEARVRNALEEGWELQGGVAVADAAHAGVSFYQAMVKRLV